MPYPMFQLYTSHEEIALIEEPTAVSIGVFDGVHRGHRHLLSTLRGRFPRLAPLVVTLTAHPSFVLGRRQSEYWLDDPEEHLRMLFEAGAKYVAVLPFTAEVATLTATEMVGLMQRELHMEALLLGYDSRFGNRSKDDFAQLPTYCAAHGIDLWQGDPYLVDGTPISSSRIRQSLLDGLVETTADLLGRRYALQGTVQHGRGVGRTLGFPTANISLASTRKMLPAEGVYAVRLNGQPGIANLGAAPTFSIEQKNLEVYLIDFDGDLYDQHAEVAFIHRLRSVLHFDSTAALQHQIALDTEMARLWF